MCGERGRGCVLVLACSFSHTHYTCGMRERLATSRHQHLCVCVCNFSCRPTWHAWRMSMKNLSHMQVPMSASMRNLYSPLNSFDGVRAAHNYQTPVRCACIYMCVCVRVCVCACVCVCVFICFYLKIYIRLCVCAHTCVCIYTYVCV